MQTLDCGDENQRKSVGRGRGHAYNILLWICIDCSPSRSMQNSTVNYWIFNFIRFIFERMRCNESGAANWFKLFSTVACFSSIFQLATKSWKMTSVSQHFVPIVDNCTHKRFRSTAAKVEGIAINDETRACVLSLRINICVAKWMIHHCGCGEERWDFTILRKTSLSNRRSQSKCRMHTRRYRVSVSKARATDNVIYPSRSRNKWSKRALSERRQT